jgi:hypothetical protein
LQQSVLKSSWLQQLQQLQNLQFVLLLFSKLLFCVLTFIQRFNFCQGFSFMSLEEYSATASSSRAFSEEWFASGIKSSDATDLPGTTYFFP